MRLKVENVGSVGLVTDVDRPEVPLNAWTTAHNVRFLRNFATPVLGYTEALTPAGDAYYLVGMPVGSEWVMAYPCDYDDDGAAEKLYAYDGTTEYNITRQVTGSDSDYTATSKWNGCAFNGVFIFNNASDCPQYWGGNTSANAADLIYSSTNTWDNYDGASNAYRAKVIRPYRNFLIALGIVDDGVDYPYLIHWSDPADPGTIPTSWDYSDPETLSGRVDIADTYGWIVDGLSLRDTFTVYKQDSIWIMTYVGGQYQFRIDKFSGTHGILAQDCVVDIGGRHVVLGDTVVYMHDGNQIKNILDGAAADEFFRGIEQTKLTSSFLVHSREFEEVWICYVPANETKVSKAYVYNYTTGVWSTRDLPQSNFIALQIYSPNTSTVTWPSSASSDSWDLDTSRSWDYPSYKATADTPVAAGAKLYAMDYGTTAAGTAFTATLERTGMRVGDMGSFALLREVYPRVAGSGSFSVVVGAESPLLDDIDWESAQTFTIGTTTKIDSTQSGELFAMRFTSDGSMRWRLSSYELDIVQIGMY